MHDDLRGLSDHDLLLIAVTELRGVKKQVCKQNGRIDKLESWKDKINGGFWATAKIFGAVIVVAGLLYGVLSCSAIAEPIDVTVVWTAPGDDGYEGQASAYDLRHATDSASLIIDWTACTEIETGIPSVAGTTDTAHAFLRPGTYYLAIKAVDDVGNWSALSNIVEVYLPDDQPPGMVVDLMRAQ